MDREADIVQHIVRRIVSEAYVIEGDIAFQGDVFEIFSGFFFRFGIKNLIQSVQRNGRLSEIGKDPADSSTIQTDRCCRV